MAQSQAEPAKKTPWTKIFTAFKVALDVKKLILAAAGILSVSIGWWVLSWAFYWIRGDAPQWKDYEEQGWSYFKAKRNSWNLLHELAGSPSDARLRDVGDVALDPDEHRFLEAHGRLSETIVIDAEKKTLELPSGRHTITISPVGKAEALELPRLAERWVGKLTLRSINFREQKDDKVENKVIEINGLHYNVQSGYETWKKLREDALKDAQAKPVVMERALRHAHEQLSVRRYKPAGRLRTLPWFENRGQNPFLLVASKIKTTGDSSIQPLQFVSALFGDQSLVLLEPLVKLLTPIVAFFDERATFWDRVYLLLVMFWFLAVWGFFGGAICRIAAVQVAKNERITLAEAIQFTRERFVSYIAAPAFPIGLLAILTAVLIVFGLLEWAPYVGDIFAGIFWVVVLLIGFIMAVVVVGLVGWPLMIATVSTEGSDSFDALSRSYSYVYLAPWQFLWYNFLAVVYGAALVFFVGMMASLMVFMGKWGVSSAPFLAKDDPARDREPSYLFYYAPTSYGWRDLLISSSPWVETRDAVSSAGMPIQERQFKDEYEKQITTANKIGAGLVAVWIYPLFLLMVGFGYSYFWSASTIVYFLMRHHLDDTDLDEVHMEDDGLEDPFLKPPQAPPTESAKSGTMSLNVVEAPPPTSIKADEMPDGASPADGAPQAGP